VLLVRWPVAYLAVPLLPRECPRALIGVLWFYVLSTVALRRPVMWLAVAAVRPALYSTIRDGRSTESLHLQEEHGQ
jgi:hypothetical protein